jgi:hypothetical protein
VPQARGAVVGLAPLQDGFQQRGLSRSVWADEPHVLAALDRKVRGFQQHAVADPEAEPFDLEDGPAAARRLEELEPEAPGSARQQIDFALRLRAFLFQALDLRQLHLRLACHLFRRGPEACDEALQPFDVPADTFGRLRGGVEAGRLLEAPCVPGALEVRRASRIELEHHVRHRFEEPAVVRDDHDPGVE